MKVIPRPSLFYKNLGEEDEATEMTAFSGSIPKRTLINKLTDIFPKEAGVKKTTRT